MLSYLAKRLAHFVLVVVGALLVAFLLLQVIADPAAMMNPLGTPESILESFREQHGLNDPLIVQAGRFIADAARLDFGDSLWLRQDALSSVLSRLPATLLLSGLATLLGGIVGVGLGVAAARRPNSALDRVLNVGSYAGISIADFWLGILGILLFSVYFGVLPSGGYSPKPAALVLPVAVLAIRPAGRLFQLTRSSMRAEYEKLYVMAARSTGLSEKAVSRGHVLRNAGITILTLGFYELARVFVGTGIVIEVLFAWPGIGRLAVTALNQGDIPLVTAVVAVGAIAVGVINLAADLLYFALDPRTRDAVGGMSA